MDDALLRVFRYKTAPWIEGGNAKTAFSIELLHQAHDEPRLWPFIIAISYGQTCSASELEMPERSILPSLHNLAPRQRNLAESLIGIATFFKTVPSSWANSRAQELEAFAKSNAPMSIIEEPEQTICKLQSRIGKQWNTRSLSLR